MRKKHEKPNYSPAVKIALAAVLAALAAALAFIIVLQARQARLERGELTPAQSAEQTDAAADEAAAQAAAAQAEADEQRAQEEAERAEAERTKRAEEAKKYSFYQKLANGYDVKMLIMGDSVISGCGASGEGTMWQNLLKDYVEEKYSAGMTVENLSGAGNSLFPDMLTVKDGDTAADCDLAVLCYGYDDPNEDFAVYFEALARAIHLKNPDCAIIYVLEATEGGHTPRMQALESVCGYYGIPVADTFAPYYALGQQGFFEALADGVHPNDKGQQIYFETVHDIIDEKVTADTGKMEDIAPLSAEAARFDNMLYIPVEKFIREDDVTFTVTAAEAGIGEGGFKGVLMLDCGYDVVREDAKVIADDILYNIPRITAIKDPHRDGRSLITVNEELVLTDSMSVTFTDKDKADKFNGVYLAWETPKEKAN